MDTLTRAISALQAGLPDQAEALCRDIIAAEPAAFEAWHVLAFIQDGQSKSTEALATYDQALSLQPGHAETLFNRANILHRLGRLDEALFGFDQALKSQPEMAAAWYNRGNTLRALGEAGQAIESYDRALALRPPYAEAHFNRAMALAGLERHAEALAGFDSTIALKPDLAQAHGLRGAALLALDRADEALASVDRGLSLQAVDVEAWNARGRALRALDRRDEALTAFDRVLSLRPDHAHALANRGNVFHDLRRYPEALASFEAALSLAPDQPRAFGGAADCVMRLCDFPRRRRYAAEMPARIADERSIIAPFDALAYLDDPALHQRCARKFCADALQDRPGPLWTGEHRPHARLRIAYLSADYRDHPVARLIAPILEAHDRSRFEITCVSFGEPGDGEMAARIAGVCDSFHDVRDLTDAEAARLLFERETDIAVDLTGHTAQARPGILAHRPAPVQAAYLGYAGTLGADFIDYIIADPVILPLSQQPFYDERIVHLQDAYLTAGAAPPGPANPPSRAEAGLPDTGFVFACFNGLWKVTPEVFDVWMRLLAQTPGSVLWLYRDTPGAEPNLRREAAARGIEPARLIFKDRTDFAQHLALHNLADLFLDTLPYNAHATAADALATGLPVVTCQGRAFPGRVGASLLRAADLPELITDDLAAYEALALKLAADPGALGGVRAKLAKAQETAPLFDPLRFTRGLEAAFESMWRSPKP